MTEKTALITGVTGQDGAYLAQLLLGKGYRVHGLRRPCSPADPVQIDRLRKDYPQRFIMHNGDITDASRMIGLIKTVEPDELYNLAAQSHVQVSFEAPKYTANANGLGVLRLLDAIRLLGMEKKIRFYQASTSELFGRAREIPQRETTPFHPRSPYAVAKLFAHWTVINHREAYGMHATNGILFNHESPLRGESFVTRKITRAAAAISRGRQDLLRLGNLDAQRDWGHARDYVEGMWMMLQQDTADDYVLGTGVATSVRTFCEWAFEEAGISLAWEGSGLAEKGRDVTTGKVLVAIDPQYMRPAEVDIIVADASKARAKLGWSHQVNVRELVTEMVSEDLKLLETGAPGI